MKTSLVRRSLFAAGAALLLIGGLPPAAMAQNKIPLRISTPAVPDDWHAKMWTVFKESLDKSAPGEFDVQINLNATLFKQGTEPAAMARGNLELATISAFDIAKLVPGVLDLHRRLRHPRSRSPAEGVQRPDRRGDVQARRREDGRHGAVDDLPRHAAGQPARGAQRARTPADLKGVKLRMPGSKEWLFLGEALGATATPLAFGEVYLGLKTGTIDGQDNPLPIGARREVLRSHQAAGADQPPRRRHLPVDREQDLERAHAGAEAEGQGRGRTPRRSTTTRTASRRKASWSTSSSSRACRSRRPTSTRSASTCRRSTSRPSTPRSGRRACSSASTRRSRRRCASG